MDKKKYIITNIKHFDILNCKGTKIERKNLIDQSV
jgi:hypothetical protein